MRSESDGPLRVVADAGPLNYLILIDAVEVLPKLFGAISVAQAVATELRHPRAPQPVRRWMAEAPTWVSVGAPEIANFAAMAKLDEGERATIALALAWRADLVLMDDREGVAAARGLGLTTVGTIGVLDRAAINGWLDLHHAVSRLRATNFRGSPSLFAALLAPRGGAPE
jgi:predicted nucleic acid-binding protein